MKTAILLATRKDDPLDVKVVRHGVYSEVLADFKTRVAEGRGESGYDSLEIWSGPPVKKHSRLSSSALSAPPVEEVPAVPSLLDGAGSGDGSNCPPIQELSEYLGRLTVEQIGEQFGQLGLDLTATKEQVIEQVLAAMTAEAAMVKVRLEAMTAEEIAAEAEAAGVAFKEGTTKEQMIELLLFGPTTFQGAPSQEEDANGEQGSTQLPDDAQAGTGEGDLSGAQAAGESGAATPGEEPELPLAEPAAGESSPGSLTPRGRRR